MVCSLILTLITIAVPTVPGDWARLDASGQYVPAVINYAWPSYGLQVALWLGIISGLWLVGRPCKFSVLLPLSAKRRSRASFRGQYLLHQAKAMMLTDQTSALKALQIQSDSSQPLQWACRVDSQSAAEGSAEPTEGSEAAPAQATGDANRLVNPQIPMSERGRGVRSSEMYALLTVITLLGFGLRLHTLDSLPLLIDEIGFAARASDILHGQHIPIFAPGHNGNPATYSWLLAGAAGLWGQNAFALRLLSLACGTLCIPAAYALGQTWWGRELGLLAAAFLATYPAHVHFSRLALYNSVDPLFALLALTVLARAVRHGRLTDYVMVGVLAGVAQYFYHGSRLLPVLIVVYMIQGFVTAKPLLMKRAFAPLGLCVMSLSFALIALPRFAPLLAGGLPLTGNLEGVRLPSDLADNALRSLLAWVGQPDVSPFWLSSTSLLPLSALLAFGLGVMVCLRNWRDPRHIVLLLTLILTTIFGGVIWAAAPLYVRYLTALPALVLLVGIGITEVQRLIENIMPRSGFQTGGFQTRPYLKFLFVVFVVLQGIILSLQHPAEALTRVPPGLWEEDRLAREAAALPAAQPAQFAVTSAFGIVERITVADYVTAYGQRRAVSVNPP
jgi:4-amino-4-deoxy-L-arabinose transferase-like glycosyltransferase